MNEEYILYTGAFLLPDENAAAHRVLNIGRSVSKSGAKVNYLERGSANIYSLEEIEQSGFKIARNKISVIGYLKYLFAIDVIKKIKNEKKLTTLILYNYHALPTLMIILYAKIKGISVLGDITEWYNTRHFSFFIRIFAKIEVSIRMRFANKHLSGLIVISEYLYQYYVKYYDDFIVKVPPLIDTDNFKWRAVKEKLAEKKVSRVSSDSIKIIYAGSPGAAKDDLNSVIKFVSICRRVSNKNIELIIAGITEQDLKNSDVKFNLNLKQKWISFVGRLNHFDVLMLYTNCDGMILFRESSRSNKAGYSTKLVEAISSDLFICINSDGFDFEDIKLSNANVISIDLRVIKNVETELSAFQKLQILEYINIMERYKKNRAVSRIYFSINNHQESVSRLIRKLR